MAELINLSTCVTGIELVAEELLGKEIITDLLDPLNSKLYLDIHCIYTILHRHSCHTTFHCHSYLFISRNNGRVR